MTTPTARVRELGQSLWYDNIERSFVESGRLAELVATDGVAGLTSNPSIFSKAVAGSGAYDGEIRDLASSGLDPETVCWSLMKGDIRRAAEVMRPVYEQTVGEDGYVSLEVSPLLARDTEGTIRQAKELWADISLPNLLIKVPGTEEGIPAVKRLTAGGIRVNVTLLFSPDRYAEVALAYISGLQEFLLRGGDPATTGSVASFFLSRIDGKVDRIIDSRPAGETVRSLRGETAIAVAKLVYGRFRDLFDGSRFAPLRAKGGREQRPLWASTSTKDAAYSDVKYVEALIGERTVNTLPPETLLAFRDHGNPASRVTSGFDEAVRTVREISDSGIDLPAIFTELEEEGVRAFADSYRQLLGTVEKKMSALR
jgi:transaldolase